jgi:hypothetical protein
MTIKLVDFDDHTADLQAEVATLRNALRHIIDRHDTPEGDAVTVQIARKALGS